MAKRFGADQWRAWFVKFEQSNQTVARFCDSIGVSVQSYYKWRQRLKSECAVPTDVGESFVPVVVQTSVVEFEFPGGAIHLRDRPVRERLQDQRSQSDGRIGNHDMPERADC